MYSRTVLTINVGTFSYGCDRNILHVNGNKQRRSFCFVILLGMNVGGNNFTGYFPAEMI